MGPRGPVSPMSYPQPPAPAQDTAPLSADIQNSTLRIITLPTARFQIDPMRLSLAAAGHRPIATQAGVPVAGSAEAADVVRFERQEVGPLLDLSVDLQTRTTLTRQGAPLTIARRVLYGPLPNGTTSIQLQNEAALRQSLAREFATALDLGILKRDAVIACMLAQQTQTADDLYQAMLPRVQGTTATINLDVFEELQAVFATLDSEDRAAARASQAYDLLLDENRAAFCALTEAAQAKAAHRSQAHSRAALSRLDTDELAGRVLALHLGAAGARGQGWVPLHEECIDGAAMRAHGLAGVVLSADTFVHRFPGFSDGADSAWHRTAAAPRLVYDLERLVGSPHTAAELANRGGAATAGQVAPEAPSDAPTRRQGWRGRLTDLRV